MHLPTAVVAVTASISFLVHASPFVDDHSLPTALEQKRQACTNTATSRSCWSDGFSVSTDFDDSWPTTGQTREYDFRISNTTCSPDGFSSRICLLVNGQYPGPLIRANWGDNIRVTVTNDMQHNGTALHWHGFRMLNTNTQDGVNGLTQCPIPPGKTEVYEFQATQFGTSWYHSHHTSQYGDGIVGPIIIDGPASQDYDEDLGAIPVSDWFYQTAQLTTLLANDNAKNLVPPPASDNILINGTNKNSKGTGEYFSTTLQANKKYRLRLINTGIDTAIRVSIDNHPMEVIATDFVPIKPTPVDSVLLHLGQRYDVIINTNQSLSNYWLRAAAETGCGTVSNAPDGSALGVIRYENAPDGNPNTKSTATTSGCAAPSPITPFVPNDAGNVTTFQQQVQAMSINLEITNTTTTNDSLVLWTLNSSAIRVQWDKPTLSYIMEGNTSYPASENVIALPHANVWSYWVIQQVEGGPVAGVPHPMHLHGHDFLVLGEGSTKFDANKDPASLQYQNPARRDTTILPANGWVALAFLTDNPGAWLFHCHIAVHISDGLGVQFLETPESIKLPDSSYTQQCQDWDTYYATALYKQDDSGL